MKKVLAWVGAVVAAAFFVAGLLALFGYPDPLTYLFGGIMHLAFPWSVFLLIGFVVFYSRRRNVADKWTDGRVGVGTIQSFSHSGRYGNVRTYRIQLQVEGEDGQRFSGSINPQVGRRNLQNLAPGVRIPVIYRESKPDKLLVPHGKLLARAQLFFDYVYQRDGVLSPTAIEAKYRGLPCRCLVQGMRQSGYREGNLIQWILDLQVFTPEGQQFSSTARVLASQMQYDLLRGANYLEAKYLPHDTSEVAVKIPKR